MRVRECVKTGREIRPNFKHKQISLINTQYARKFCVVHTSSVDVCSETIFFLSPVFAVLPRMCSSVMIRLGVWWLRSQTLAYIRAMSSWTWDISRWVSAMARRASDDNFSNSLRSCWRSEALCSAFSTSFLLKCKSLTVTWRGRMWSRLILISAEDSYREPTKRCKKTIPTSKTWLPFSAWR